jgi:hypothetical protein
MRVATTENGWALEAIGDLEWMFLERLPGMAAGEDLAAEQKQRLLPDPIGPPTAADDFVDDEKELEEFRTDWDEFVRPELNLAFADARALVAEDLKRVTESSGADIFVADDDDDEHRDDDQEADEEDALLDGMIDPEARYFRLEVAGEHSELWYNTLNQARLLMNEVYNLADSEKDIFEQMMQRQPEVEQDPEDGEDGSDDAKVTAPDGILLMLLAQYQFYSFIQNFLVERVMKP